MTRRASIGAARFALATFILLLLPGGASAQTFGVLGQPDLASTTLATRCADANARFNFSNVGFEQHGPSGIAVASTGRLFVTDFAGDRVLSWPNAASLTACQAADRVIAGVDGPEAVAVDDTGTVYVAATLNHTVQIFEPDAGGNYVQTTTLGIPDFPGATNVELRFPRGLAINGNKNAGQLYVADDGNDRVQIFTAPFTNAETSTDSVGAGLDGGFDGPKAVAFGNGNLFVADYNKNRVLRFDGPFDNPAATYDATATFSGLANPVDLAIAGNGVLHVTDQANRRVASYLGAGTSADRTAPDTSFSDNIGPEPLGLAVHAGRLFLADYRQYRVLIRDPAPGSPVDPNPPTLDTTAPTVTITKAPDRKIEKPKAKFKFEADEANVTFECKFDRDQFEECGSPARYKRVDDGKHKFKVRATDVAGNRGAPDKARFKVDAG